MIVTLVFVALCVVLLILSELIDRAKRRREPLIKDWYQDSHLENGNYQNICAICNEMFVGHKSRCVCKVCWK